MDTPQLVDVATLTLALSKATTPPAPTNGFDWLTAEAIGVTVAKTNIINLPMVITSSRRKIYVYVGTTPSNALDYFVDAVLQFWLNNSLVGELPLGDANSPGASPKLNASLPSVFVGGGNVVADSIALSLSGRASTVVLQPQYIRVKADRATISIRKLDSVTTVDFWLGVFSSEL